ncbi:MAG: hypothetical protein MJY42_02840 [Bacteroidales bacterium]|nr:hypothetical protein [Bacteroidales bacterium]
MAKVSEFEKFKSGLSGNPTTRSLGAAISRKTEAPVITGKTTDPNKKQVSHYMDEHLLEQLGILKVKSRKSMSALYEEAIYDLLKKYGYNDR